MKKSFHIQIIAFSVCLFGIQQIACSQSPYQPNIYEIDATLPVRTMKHDHLKLGGANKKGESIEVNSYYVSMNGKPVVLVSGEFHFSRYPRQYWEEAIRKMKAGGIDLIATYIFWNMHEEFEGKFDWKEYKDVRKFVEQCQKNGVKVIVRIGPFCHGEIRNGGLPDWLFGRMFDIRSNDQEYLAYTERLYSEIGKQLKGLYFKDGGPIIGIQLENEYQHSAAPWALTYAGQPDDFTVARRDIGITRGGVAVSDTNNPYAKLGSEHMRVLKALALKAGMEVPIFTATGWGYAAIIPNESLPVNAAYPYPTWVPVATPSPFYTYKDLQKTPDYPPVTYVPEDYPYFAAEIGGGMMPKYSRRPTIPAKSLDALINRFLGSGANGVGYYMYHGGATTRGQQYFFSDEAYGYQKINYDYQAALGQYGQAHPSFHRLKLLHFFLKEFGDRLAPLPLVLPSTYEKATLADTTLLRYSLREYNGSGFIFLNNFQDHLATTDKKDIQIKIKTSKGDMLVPENPGFALKSKENAIFPFNFDLGGINLLYATAQLLTKGGDTQDQYFVFFAPEGTASEFSIAKNGGTELQSSNCTVDSNDKRWLVRSSGIAEFQLKKSSGDKISVLVVEKTFALKSWLVSFHGKQHVVFSDAFALDNGNTCEFYSKGSNSFDFEVYPKIKNSPKIPIGTITNNSDAHSILSRFHVEVPEQKLKIEVKRFGTNKLQAMLPDALPKGVSDIFLTINYIGDTGMALMNDVLVDDQFYYGQPWEIGLKKFLAMPHHKHMNFYFRPMYKNATYLVDLESESIPDFQNQDRYLKIDDVRTTLEYKALVIFEK